MEKIHLIQKIANSIKNTIDLEKIKLPDEFFYKSLPLCIIDAVYSISVTYASTRNTVIRFCDHCRIERISEERRTLDEFPSPEMQMSIDESLSLYHQMSSEEMAVNVFKNRQRTSSKNGILKSEAVKLFITTLQDVGINYFQDLKKYNLDNVLFHKITAIPGQKSGISYNYFLMLCGNKNLVKPDRMVRSYLKGIIGNLPGEEESQMLLHNSLKILNEKYPNLTLRELDYAIWSYQRTNR